MFLRLKQRIRVRPYRGRWCTRAQANEINDMLLSATKPDRTALHEEVKEFEKVLQKLKEEGKL